jgi:membrane associated rhomboid family serine protease
MILFLPVGVDHRASRLPVVTFTLMGVNIAVFALLWILELSGGEAAEEWILSNLWLVPGESGLHTYLTSMFVHEGLLHLAGNMVYLFLFGACVEDVIGRGRFLAFYLAGGLAAALTHRVLAGASGSDGIPMGGASGAICACVGGFLLLFTKTKVEFRWLIWMFFWFRTGEFFLPAWLVIGVWFSQDLLGLILNVTSGHEGGGVAFAAHVGGTLAGLAMIGAFKRWHRDGEPEGETISPPVRVRIAPAATRGTPDEIPSIYVYHDEHQTGPHTLNGIRQLAGQGQIPGHAQYWQEGMSEWAAIGDLLG